MLTTYCSFFYIQSMQSLEEYTGCVIDAINKLHINEVNTPTLQELILLYVCQMLNNYVDTTNDLYLIDIYIINRFYHNVMNILEQQNDISWSDFWQDSSVKIIKYTTQQEIDEIAKWVNITEDVVLEIAANNKRFDYITQYDNKLSNKLFNKYIITYLEYYADFHNINKDC